MSDDYVDDESFWDKIAGIADRAFGVGNQEQQPPAQTNQHSSMPVDDGSMWIATGVSTHNTGSMGVANTNSAGYFPKTSAIRTLVEAIFGMVLFMGLCCLSYPTIIRIAGAEPYDKPITKAIILMTEFPATSTPVPPTPVAIYVKEVKPDGAVVSDWSKNGQLLIPVPAKAHKTNTANTTQASSFKDKAILIAIIVLACGLVIFFMSR